MAEDNELQEGLVTPEKEEEDSTPSRPGDIQNTAADWVRDMRMSADVNNTTVGVNTDRVTPDLLVATSKKLLKLNRREVEQDPKDSLQFQRVYGPQEYFSEHILRDGSRLARQLLWKATNKGNLDFMQVGALDQHVSDVFNNSKLANMVDGSSPLELADATFKITRIGEGGVADISSAPDEMRLVQPSFLGYIDGVRSPESLKVGLDAYIAKNVMKGSDGKLYQKFINAHTGKEELVDSVTAAKSVVTTPDMMNTKSSHCYAVGGKTGVRIVKKSDVDYYLPHMDEAFSAAANFVTGMSGVKEMRLLMGCLHPYTGIVTISNKNDVNIVLAKDVGPDTYAIPSMDKDGNDVSRKLRASVARWPSARNWFRKVVLYSGRAMVTSRDHRWTVLRKGKVEQIRADRLKPGDMVLRSLFTGLPSRRTYINHQRINKDIAVLLGYAVRSLAEPRPGKLTVAYSEKHKDVVKQACEKLDILDSVCFYSTHRQLYVSFKPGWFADWLRLEVGVEDEARRVPSCILSAGMDIAALFLDAYSADETLVGIDGMQFIWLLELPNMLLRDGIALLLARVGTDTLYRDAVQSGGVRQLALKLVPAKPLYGDFALDEVKTVLPAHQAALMIDLDLDDGVFASSCGLVTHNSKYPMQALSTEGREAPLVRGIDSATGKTVHEVMGKYFGARFAKRPGKVLAVRQDRIDVLYDDGTKASVALYKNFPMNAKGFITNTPRVKAGDTFGKGDLLASSNYTDEKGVAAPGVNLRTAWLSWKGGTYEDAVVLSESAAKKLAATSMYSSDLDLDKTVTLGKRNYLSWKPGEYTKGQLDALDDDGIVKPGTVLHEGDPMVLAVQTAEPSPGTLGKRILTDVSQTWEHQHPGVVTDVVRTKKGVRVLATVTAPVEVGDKVSGLYGNKGVCSMVLPDDQMPKDKDGNPMEMLLSPLGLISRCNPAQLHEALLGKVARRTGKTEILPAFYDGSIKDYVTERLRKAHLDADDDLFDPETGKKIPKVVNGVSYICRLKHLADSKLSARGTDAYSVDDTPGGSGYEGSKRFGTLELGAMVGHSAFQNLLDAKLIRGQSNSDFWREVRTGGIPTIPGEPLVQKKFFAHLQGSGINVRKTGKGISVFSLSSGDVDALAGPREVKSRDTYEAKNFRPISGGLFGQDVFGVNGDKWGYIQLDEPVPNPVMEEPLARLLRIPEKDLVAVASGTREVNGMKSAVDLKKRLAQIDLEREARQAQLEFKSAPASKKDAALKRYVAIEEMRRQGVQPADYMLDKIPVLPPVYRPISSHGGTTMVADANYLYAQLLDARDDMREAKDLPKEYQDKARSEVYRAWKELTGLYDPEDVKLRNKNIGGLLKWALGDSPKFSGFQRKVLGMSVDTVGRGAIVPDSKLTVDQIGIPIPLAMDTMAPFVERKLVGMGYTPVDAMKMVKKRLPQALKVLDEVIQTHPVEMNRAPSLHKYNIMAFKPVLVQGNAIHVHPSVCPGFAADFDGDQQIGCVKVRISKELLLDEKLAKKFKQEGLQKIIAMLYYACGRNADAERKENTDTAYRKLKTLTNTISIDGKYVVADLDLADIPHGRLLRKNGGIKGNTDFYEALPGLQVLAYDEDEHKLKWADVSCWSEHRNCAVEIVHLNNGTDIITDDDPRAVYGIAKDAETLVPQRFTPTEAEAAGVCVPCARTGLSVTTPECEYSFVCEQDAMPCLEQPEGRSYRLDFEFGQVLGILAGDGWWDKKNREHLELFGGPRGVYVSDNEGMNAAYVSNYVKEHVDPAMLLYSKQFNKEQYKNRFGNTVRYAMYGQSLPGFCDMLTELLGGRGDASTAGSGNKRLPGWVQATPAEFRRGLVCGLIATDGAISVSRAKNKPQLMIGFCSTSLRMCRELIAVLRSLGARASLTFSKTTQRGNKAWQVTVSTVDAKHLDLFHGLANERKARVFETTEVSEDACHVHGDYRVFPKCVSDVVFKWLRAPKVKSAKAAGMDESEVSDCRQVLSLYLSVDKYAKLGYITLGAAQKLAAYAEEENKRRARALNGLRTSVEMLEKDVKCPLDDKWKRTTWRQLNMLSDQLDHALYVYARAIVSRRATTFGTGCQGLLDALRKVVSCEFKDRFGLSEEPLFKEWLDMALNGQCAWTFIDSVEKTGQVETGYDLTVPGYETFMSSDGVVLSNTVNIHVPVSDNARREALNRMLPSKNLIGVAEHKIMNKPEKEYMQGLYIATRMGSTPDGRARIFRTLAEARDAYRRGEIDVDTPIQILEKQ